MKLSGILTTSIVQILFLFSQICFADNPIIQTNYTADPAPMAKGDTLYLYTSHDEDNAQGFVMYNWMLYSTTDMVNWRDHGIVASLKNFTWENGNAWAPQCCFRNGKYYLYCPLNRKGGNISVGVLVATRPEGPFTDPLGRPLVTDNSPQSDYDPSIFVDDDGQAYLYFGGNGPCYVVKLNDDMISLKGSIQQAVINGATGIASYTEGPWLYKHNGIYYLSWASRCCPEGIGYAMSNNPMGPWQCKGVIMAPNDTSSGNHPGLVDFKGKSYVFGFDYELLYSRIPYSPNKPERRSICVKEMTFNADSTIKQVPWWGHGVPRPGVTQIRNFNPYDTVQAETICWSFGVRTEVCKDSGGGIDVDSIHNGDFIKVKGVDFGSAGAESFEARVASSSNGGSIDIHLDTLTGPLVGTCAISSTSGWQTWTTKSCTISNATGIHDVYFKFTGGNGLLFNFNWWKFTPEPKVSIDRSQQRLWNSGNSSMILSNGATQTLQFDFNKQIAGNVDLSVYDASGRLLSSIHKTVDIKTSVLSFPLGQKILKSGIFFVQISQNKGTLVTRALIVP
jgi:hypothetical protein